MRNTTKYSLPVPSAGTDVDDVPTHLGGLGDAIDLALGSRGGSYASRPAASIEGQMYFVTGSGTNAGLLYRDNGSTWDQVNYPGGPTGSITTMGFSDSPAAGTPSSGYAPIDHRHGSQSNPVTPHVAATNPHPQYATLSELIFGIPRTAAGLQTLTNDTSSLSSVVYVSNAAPRSYARLYDAGSVNTLYIVYKNASSGCKLHFQVIRNTGTGRASLPDMSNILADFSYLISGAPTDKTILTVPIGNTVNINQGDWFAYWLDSTSTGSPVYLYHTGGQFSTQLNAESVRGLLMFGGSPSTAPTAGSLAPGNGNTNTTYGPSTSPIIAYMGFV